MQTTNDVPLIEALKKVALSAKAGSLTVMAGAGISKDDPCHLPTFEEFRCAIVDVGGDLLAHIIKEEETRSSLEAIKKTKMWPEHFFSIFSEVFETGNVTPKDNFLNLFAKFFDVDGFNINHMTIAQLMKRGCVSSVLTTNFDCCIENALKRLGLSPESDYITRKHPDQYARTLPLQKPKLSKLHGSADELETIRIVYRQYLTSLDSSVINALIREIKGTTLLIAGYSGNDQDVFPLLTRTLPWKELIWIAFPGDPGIKQIKAQLSLVSYSTKKTCTLVEVRFSTFCRLLPSILGGNWSSETRPTANFNMDNLRTLLGEELFNLPETGLGTPFLVRALGLLCEHTRRPHDGGRFLITAANILEQMIKTSSFSRVGFMDTQGMQEWLYYQRIMCLVDLSRIHGRLGQRSESMNHARKAYKLLMQPEVAVHIVDESDNLKELTVPLPLVSPALSPALSHIRGRVWLNLAAHCMDAGNLDEGIQLNRNVLEEGSREDQRTQYDASINLVRIFASTHDYRQLQPVILKAVHWAGKLKDTDAMYQILSFLGIAHFKQALEVDIEPIILEMRSLSQELSDQYFVFQSYLFEIELALKKKDSPRMRRVAMEILKFCDHALVFLLEDKNLSFSIYNIGWNLANSSDIDVGTRLMDHAAKILEYFNDSRAVDFRRTAAKLKNQQKEKKKPMRPLITGGITILMEEPLPLGNCSPELVEIGNLKIYPPQYQKGTVIIIKSDMSLQVKPPSKR